MKRILFVIMLSLLVLSCREAEEVVEPTAVLPTEAVQEEQANNSEAEADTESDTLPTSLDGSITLTKATYQPEEAIEIRLVVNTPLADDAWVGIVPSDTPHGSELENDAVDISYTYINNLSDEGTLTLYAPVDAGQYDVRLFNTDASDGVELASISIAVGNVDPASESGNGTEGSEVGEEVAEAPEETAPPVEEEAETETAVVTNSGCIIGTWRVTNLDEYLVASIESNMPAEGGFTVSAETTGDLLITFTPEEMSMSSNDYAVIVTAAGQTIPVAVTAEGTANYQTDGNTISNIVTTYDSTASAGGQTISVDMAWFTAAGVEGGTVTYTCDGDAMSWTEPYPINILFDRVN